MTEGTTIRRACATQRVHAMLLATVAAAAVSPAVARAQSADAAQQPAAAAEIVVTGSHIKTSNFNSSSPLVVIDAAEIRKGGDTNIADFLGHVPSIVGADTASSNQVNTATSSGLNTVALRNLGPTRTLVLVNGRRYVSGVSAGAGYGVDLNSIPTAIIKRVDVLTGGQSAAYGSDAIAGVINIITSKNFEGIAIDGQFGQTGHSDRKTYDGSITVGGNFGDGKGNAWLSVGYSRAEGIMAHDRQSSAISYDAIASQAGGLLDTAAFIGSSFIPKARIAGFKGDGTPFTRGTNTIATSDAFNFNDYRQYISPFKRLTAAARVNYEVTDRLSVDLEANYARVESSGRFEPIPLSVTADVFKSNFGGVSNIIIDPALGTVSPFFNGTPLQAALIGAGVRTLDQASFVGRRLVEFGTRGEDNRRQTFRIAASLDYKLAKDLTFTLSGTYGQTTQNQTVPGDINLERARFAVDIVPDGRGGFMCRDATARNQGCVPFNPFAPPSDPLGIGISQAAINYLKITGSNVGAVSQGVLSGVLAGGTGFDPFGAGQLSFATGAEYRREAGSDTPDSFRQAGIARGLLLKPTDGNYNVVDLFGEFKLPVARQLTIDGSARYGHYSTIGSTFTWKVGFDAPVADFLRLRGAISRAVRAPNVADLYAGGSGTAAIVFDPCDGITAATAGTVAQNCRSIASIATRIAGAGSFTLTQPEKQNTLGLILGSPTTGPEKAMSYTAGTVFTIPAGSGKLSIAADFYNVKIDDAIVNLDRTLILTRCFNAATAAFDPTCGGTTVRSPATGAALSVNSITGNNNQVKTTGLDLDVDYKFTINNVPGSFKLAATGNLLFKYAITDYASKAVTRLDGEVLYPHVRFNLNAGYAVGKVGFDWRMTYWGKTVDSNSNTKLAPAFNKFGAQIYHDFRMIYHVNKGIDLNLGIRNAFDNKPPLLTNQNKYLQQGTNSNGTAWDILGRRWFIGFNAKI